MFVDIKFEQLFHVVAALSEGFRDLRFKASQEEPRLLKVSLQGVETGPVRLFI